MIPLLYFIIERGQRIYIMYFQRMHSIRRFHLIAKCITHSTSHIEHYRPVETRKKSRGIKTSQLNSLPNARPMHQPIKRGIPPISIIPKGQFVRYPFYPIPKLLIPFHHTHIILYPTVPSRDTLNNFWASTANSIGSLLSTSLAYPLTIRPTASSVEMPRWLQ